VIRRSGSTLVAAGAVFAFAAMPLSSGAASPKFSYDTSRSLDLRLGEVQSNAGVVRQALTFDAGRGRTAGFWIHPAASGPWPVVLFSPGSGGTAANQVPDAERLALKGIASLTVTPQRTLWTCHAAADVRIYSNYVVGRRRALDLLPHLSGADPSRVAAMGFSFGSAVTASLAGVDHRLRGAVIQSGRAHLSTAIGTACKWLGRKKLRAYVRAYSVIDPVRYVSRAAPASLLFQNGRRDSISPAKDVNAYVNAASGPKELRWYDTGHDLNEQAREERDAWLVKLLLAEG
jgi:dienelactone hydrolase